MKSSNESKKFEVKHGCDDPRCACRMETPCCKYHAAFGGWCSKAKNINMTRPYGQGFQKLHSIIGGSDKLYELYLAQTNEGYWDVMYANGRRSSGATSGHKSKNKAQIGRAS